jgi:hypothetical protein
MNQAPAFVQHCDNPFNGRFLFELFHIEKQLSKFADEADGHSARLNECEANCKAISKGQDKKNREKSSKDKEWAVFDNKVRDLEKQIKKVEGTHVLRIDEYLDGKKSRISQLEKDIKTIQVDSLEIVALSSLTFLFLPHDTGWGCAGKGSRCEEKNPAS